MKTKAAVLYEMGLAGAYETSQPLHIEKLHSHDLKLGEINSAFDRFAIAEAVRQLIRF